MGLSSLFGGGGSTTPNPPAIYPLNIGVTDTAARSAGLYQWNLSQDQYAKQYPGIVASQNKQMDSIVKGLTGPLDPTLERSFVGNSEAQAMTAFGGGQENPNITGQGSIGRNTVGAGIASQTQNYQDYLRNQANSLISQYPQANMPSPNNIVDAAITNLSNQVAANSQAAGVQAAQRGQQAQAQAAGTSTAIGAGSALLSSALSASAAAGLISW